MTAARDAKRYVIKTGSAGGERRISGDAPLALSEQKFTIAPALPR